MESIIDDEIKCCMIEMQNIMRNLQNKIKNVSFLKNFVFTKLNTTI